MKITVKNVLIILLPMIIANLVGISLIYYMLNDLVLITAIMIILFISITIVPTIYLLINYLKNDKNLTVLFGSDEIVITSKKSEDVILVKNIENITLNGSKNIFEKLNIRFSTFDDFYYAEIKTTDGKIFIITNLLSIKLKEQLMENYQGIEISYNYRLFPSIKYTTK